MTNSADDTIDNGHSCIIVTGAPGSGKSTVTVLVARAFARSALLNGDQISRLIVSGHVWALGDPAEEADRQVRLCNENVCALARNVADSGFTPVIDWIIPDRHQLDYYLDALAPRRVLLVVLPPGIDVCKRRNAVRNPDDQFSFDDYGSLTTSMREGFGTVGWWFDTSRLTPDETASQIITKCSSLAHVDFRSAVAE